MAPGRRSLEQQRQLVQRQKAEAAIAHQVVETRLRAFHSQYSQYYVGDTMDDSTLLWNAVTPIQVNAACSNAFQRNHYIDTLEHVMQLVTIECKASFTQMQWVLLDAGDYRGSVGIPSVVVNHGMDHAMDHAVPKTVLDRQLNDLAQELIAEMCHISNVAG